VRAAQPTHPKPARIQVEGCNALILKAPNIFGGDFRGVGRLLLAVALFSRVFLSLSLFAITSRWSCLV
jgi:hypothetical protein